MGGPVPEVPELPPCLFVLDSFRSVRPLDADRVLESVRATPCALDPCPLWLSKSFQEKVLETILKIITMSLTPCHHHSLDI